MTSRPGRDTAANRSASIAALAVTVLCASGSPAEEQEPEWKAGRPIPDREVGSGELGVELTIAMPKRTYVRGEPIYVLVVAKNVSDEARQTRELEGQWENADDLQFRGKTPGGRKVFHAYGSQIPRSSPGEISLKPGERTVGEFEITEHSNIGGSGPYEFSVSMLLHYEELAKGRVRGVRMRSNTIRFEIRPPAGSEQKQYDVLAGRGRAPRVRLGACLGSTLESFLRAFPTSVYAPHVRYEVAWRAEQTMYLRRAIEHYRVIAEQDRSCPLADNALLRLGACHLKLSQPDEALEAFDKLLSLFPDSEQRKRARHLREIAVQDKKYKQARRVPPVQGPAEEAPTSASAENTARETLPPSAKAVGPEADDGSSAASLATAFLCGLGLGAAGMWGRSRRRAAHPVAAEALCSGSASGAHEELQDGAPE